MKDTNTVQEKSFEVETTAPKEQVEFRKRLVEFFDKAPMSLEDKLFNVGLFTRSSILVKFLLLSDIYKRVVKIPGCMIEFGTWRGQNLVLLENLRAIYEPFNKQRILVGFDTFTGYSGLSDRDKESPVWNKGSYDTGIGYIDYLAQLLEIHEGSNCLGHLRGNHRLVQGDVVQTVPEYFDRHPGTLVAFAYFDMALYEPTKVALLAIKPHLVKGSIILLDELTWQESPGEAIAFKEVFNKNEVLIEKCTLYPSKSIITVL